MADNPIPFDAAKPLNTDFDREVAAVGPPGLFTTTTVKRAAETIRHNFEAVSKAAEFRVLPTDPPTDSVLVEPGVGLVDCAGGGGGGACTLEFYDEGILVDSLSCGGGGGPALITAGQLCGYICGFLASGTTTQVTVTSGCARNDDDDDFLFSSSSLIANYGILGAGGRDAAAADGFWYIWVVRDPVGPVYYAILSQSSSAPSVPLTHKKRRVGSLKVVSGAILPFQQEIQACGRETHYLAPVLDHLFGNPASYTTAFYVGSTTTNPAVSFSVAGAVPPTSNKALLCINLQSPNGLINVLIRGTPFAYELRVYTQGPLPNTIGKSEEKWVNLDPLKMVEFFGVGPETLVDSWVEAYVEEI